MIAESRANQRRKSRFNGLHRARGVVALAILPHIVPLPVAGVPSGAAAKTTAYPAAHFGDTADLSEGRI